MILLDSDVMIDILRKYPPAMVWFQVMVGLKTIQPYEK